MGMLMPSFISALQGRVLASRPGFTDKRISSQWRVKDTISAWSGGVNLHA